MRKIVLLTMVMFMVSCGWVKTILTPVGNFNQMVLLITECNIENIEGMYLKIVIDQKTGEAWAEYVKDNTKYRYDVKILKPFICITIDDVMFRCIADSKHIKGFGNVRFLPKNLLNIGLEAFKILAKELGVPYLWMKIMPYKNLKEDKALTVPEKRKLRDRKVEEIREKEVK